MLQIANNSEFKLYLPDEHFETIASKIGGICCMVFDNIEATFEFDPVQTIL